MVSLKDINFKCGGYPCLFHLPFPTVLNFYSEIEFEDGAKEIGIEFASLDLEFSPQLNLRAGIILNPIGSFNQNHDGPKWEFVDRPVCRYTNVACYLEQCRVWILW